MTAYQIGVVYPLERPRGIFSGEEIRPTWYALTVPPNKEKAARETLRAQGVYAFYPSETKRYRNRFSPDKPIKVERPIVSSLVYAMFRHAPQWDVMKEQRRIITGVYSINGSPIAIPSDVIRHLQGMTVEAERLREAKADLLRIREGDRATIVSGPLAGFAVDVDSVAHGQVWFRFLTGGKGSADIGSLQREVPATCKD